MKILIICIMGGHEASTELYHVSIRIATQYPLVPAHFGNIIDLLSTDIAYPYIIVSRRSGLIGRKPVDPFRKN